MRTVEEIQKELNQLEAADSYYGNDPFVVVCYNKTTKQRFECTFKSYVSACKFYYKANHSKEIGVISINFDLR